MPRLTPTFLDRVAYGLERLLIAGVSLLPELVSYGIAHGLGRLYFRCARGRRRVALANLRRAYPGAKTDAELLAIASRATGNVFESFLDSVLLPATGARAHPATRIENPEWVQRIPKGPVLLLSAHLGSWEYAMVACALSGRPCHVVGRTVRNPLLAAHVFAVRESFGVRVYPRRGGFRSLTRGVLRGGIGIQAVDQNQRLRGVFAPWFGELASCERAAATLALRKRIPLVVGVCVRTHPSRRRFRVEIHEPFVPESTGDRDRDVLALVTRVNGLLEELILRFPDQYLWIHDRYRTRPPAPQSLPATEESTPR